MSNQKTQQQVAEEIKEMAKEYDGLKARTNIHPEYFENELWVEFVAKSTKAVGSRGIDDIVREFDLEYFPASEGLAGAGFWADTDNNEEKQVIHINFKKVFEQEGE